MKRLIATMAMLGCLVLGLLTGHSMFSYGVLADSLPKVTNLEVVADGNTAKVSWGSPESPPEAIEMYIAECNGETKNTSGLSINFDISSWAPGNYTVNVKAKYITLGTSEPASASFKIAARDLPSPPAAPTRLIATGQSSSSILVEWQGVPEATSYKVFRSSDPGSGFAEVSTVNSSSYTDSGLSSNRTYYYQVQAFNEHGGSPMSSSVEGRTLAASKPAAPSGIRASEITEKGVTLSWNAVSDAWGYKIFFSKTQNTGYTEVADVSTATWKCDNLEPDTEYYIQIEAYNESGSSPRSTTVQILTLDDGTKPLNIPLTITDQTEDSLTLNWQPLQDADKIRIYRSMQKDSGFGRVAEVDGKETSWQDTGLESGTIYYYKISIVDEQGNESAPTEPFLGMTIAIPVPIEAEIDPPRNTNILLIVIICGAVLVAGLLVVLFILKKKEQDDRKRNRQGKSLQPENSRRRQGKASKSRSAGQNQRSDSARGAPGQRSGDPANSNMRQASGVDGNTPNGRTDSRSEIRQDNRSVSSSEIRPDGRHASSSVIRQDNRSVSSSEIRTDNRPVNSPDIRPGSMTGSEIRIQRPSVREENRPGARRTNTAAIPAVVPEQTVATAGVQQQSVFTPEQQQLFSEYSKVKPQADSVCYTTGLQKWFSSSAAEQQQSQQPQSGMAPQQSTTPAPVPVAGAVPNTAGQGDSSPFYRTGQIPIQRPQPAVQQQQSNPPVPAAGQQYPVYSEPYRSGKQVYVHQPGNTTPGTAPQPSRGTIYTQGSSYPSENNYQPDIRRENTPVRESVRAGQ